MDRRVPCWLRAWAHRRSSERTPPAHLVAGHQPARAVRSESPGRMVARLSRRLESWRCSSEDPGMRKRLLTMGERGNLVRLDRDSEREKPFLVIVGTARKQWSFD